MNTEFKVLELYDEDKKEEAFIYWKNRVGKYLKDNDKADFERSIKLYREIRDKNIKIEIPKLNNPLNEIGEILALRAEQHYKGDKIQDELLEVVKEQLEIGKGQMEQLREIIDKLSSQLNSVNQTLDFILNSMGANFQRIERQQILENKQLAELLSIVSEKDENKMKKFIKEHGIDSLGLILQLFLLFTGKG